MQKDIRETDLYRQAEALYGALRRPGAGLISDAAEISTNGTHAVFTGTLVEALNGVPPTRICLTDLATGDTRVMTFGPNVDRLPKFSPNGRYVAFLSDRHKAGDFQLYLLDPASGAARSTPAVEGWVEYLHWSPDGTRVLLGVAGHGADTAGAQGAVTSKRVDEAAPSWMPEVETGDESYGWRGAWVYELATDQTRQISNADLNVWEAVWCGNEAIAALGSPGPGEGLWYSACLHIVDVKTGSSRELYRPRDQLGWPSASPSGNHLAVVEALCSDRWIVAGDLRLFDMRSGQACIVDTHGVDVTHAEWRSDRQLLLAGHRGFESVVGLLHVNTLAFTEVWCSEDLTGGGLFMTAAGCNDSGDCVLVGESFTRAPEIAVIRQGQYRTVKSFDLGNTDQVTALDAVERVRWKARDGLQLQGWLLRPKGKGPYPLIMCVHGGPVWHWRPMWLGRRLAHVLMLIKRGYAVFLPNARGGSGRGQEFARSILGDLGGADTYDYLSGLDHLVALGVADPERLGVTGGSYGGFMTTWLITQDSRFAAAVAVAPITNHLTARLISNIPHFERLFLGDTYIDSSGKYFQRSPVLHAHQVKTPTLSICGSMDRCTPPEEALQFHHALLENGVRSELVRYPEEGHGVRKWPAVIDFAARLVAWFEEHMPAQR